MKNGEIFDYLCGLAPLELQMSFDNAGFLIGDKSADVSRVLLSLDVTDKVIDEAIETGAGLIVSHHPVIFNPLRSVLDESAEQARICKLIRNGISVISMHTNLDIADGGVNDVLLSLLGAAFTDYLDDEHCGRIGVLEEEIPLSDFLDLCKNKLNVTGLRYVDGGKRVKRLAVMGGAGGDEFRTAFEKGCDTYVTADVKYHQFLEASELGLNLIDADHFCTENPVMLMLCDKLAGAFPSVSFSVSRRHHQTAAFW